MDAGKAAHSPGERGAAHAHMGQSALEFLFATGAMVLVFIMASILFYESGADASALGTYAESNRVCHEASAQVASIAAAGDGASSVFVLPKTARSESYALGFSSPNRLLSVFYRDSVAGCALPSSDVSNRDGEQNFNVTEDLPIRNANGGVVIG